MRSYPLAHFPNGHRGQGWARLMGSHAGRPANLSLYLLPPQVCTAGSWDQHSGMDNTEPPGQTPAPPRPWCWKVSGLQGIAAFRVVYVFPKYTSQGSCPLTCLWPIQKSVHFPTSSTPFGDSCLHKNLPQGPVVKPLPAMPSSYMGTGSSVGGSSFYPAPY